MMLMWQLVAVVARRVPVSFVSKWFLRPGLANWVLLPARAGSEGDPASWLRLAGAEASVCLGEHVHPVLVRQARKVIPGEDGDRQPVSLGAAVAVVGELGDLLDVKARAVQAAADGFPGWPGPPAGRAGRVWRSPAIVLGCYLPHNADGGEAVVGEVGILLPPEVAGPHVEDEPTRRNQQVTDGGCGRGQVGLPDRRVAVL